MLSTVRAIHAPLAISMIVLGACSGEQRQLSVAVADSAGVRIVTSAQPAWEGVEGGAWAVDETHSLEIPGDFGDPAFERLKELLRQGLTVARKNGDASLEEKLQTLETRRQELRAQVKVDEWALSGNVHFNQLLELSPTEFRGLVAAYRQALRLFACESCGSLLAVVSGPASAVSCSCLETQWLTSV